MRKTVLIIVAMLIPCFCFAGTIDVNIKGVDDGIKTSKQKDYKEAVLFAKREAIERAGLKIKSMTTVKDMVVNSDYIESKAEAALLPGYNILDMGYAADGTYQVVLIGKVKSAVSAAIDSKELRYAKSLFDMGKESEAKKIINDILNNSKDESTVTEAMYYKVLWKFSSDPAVTYAKLKAYYPDSKYVPKLKSLLDEREAERKRKIEINFGDENITNRDGRFIVSKKGVVYDTHTGLMWAAKDNGENITWNNAKRYCEEYIGGGYSDWRMPTPVELSLLNGKIKSDDVYLCTELIDITACCPWSSETRDSEAVYYDLSNNIKYWDYKTSSSNSRALPVRNIK